MMTSIKDLLLIESYDLGGLIEQYRHFFLAVLPSVFMLAVIVEYFDRLEPLLLAKRAFISIILLTSISTFYHSSISKSIEVADEMLQGQKQGNILLMDMLSGVKHWEKVKHKTKKIFYKDRNYLTGTLSFLKYHLFESFLNDGFTVVVYFISSLCFLILKVVYSLVYYLGYGLIGVPCLIYLFPSMGNVLRGGILSFIWCLIIPHILVFIVSMIGAEINKGYVTGQMIGGSMIGTGLLFILTLFIAFTPLIGMMILTGAGISSAGGVIASMGANFVMNLPKNTLNTVASTMTGGVIGPKMKMATSFAKGGYRMAKNAKTNISNRFKKSRVPQSNKSNINTESMGVGTNNQINSMNQELTNILTQLNSPNKTMAKRFKDASTVKFSLPITTSNQSRLSRGRSEELPKYNSRNNRSEKAFNNNHNLKRSSEPSDTDKRSRPSVRFKR